MKLTNIKQIKGVIELVSGLHIGAGDSEMRIGGTDNPVVTNPHTGEPYIPGSSLKGKMRALLEMRSGLVDPGTGSPLGTKSLQNLSGAKRDEAMSILRLFGISGAEGDETAIEVGPTRASFADCPLSRASRKNLVKGNLSATEVKAETAIDRIQGTAKGRSLRFTERVVAGMSFDFFITLKEMDGDETLEEYLLQGLKLLELDALGGSGSRGYGRVRFELDDEGLQRRFADISPIG